MAGRSNEPIQFPMRISQNQRKAPTRGLWSWFLVLVAGLLPFGAISLELYSVLVNVTFGTSTELLSLCPYSLSLSLGSYQLCYSICGTNLQMPCHRGLGAVVESIL